MVISGVICAKKGPPTSRGVLRGTEPPSTAIVPWRAVRFALDQRARLLIAFAVALALFTVEAVFSIASNSLALLAESFHVLIDAVALGIAALAVWLAARPTTERRTYGLLRLEILATVLNTVLLLVVASVVLLEGIRRFSEPFAVDSRLVIPVASLGLAANVATLFLLRDPGRSLVARATCLGVASDRVGSAAVLVCALAGRGFQRLS